MKDGATVESRLPRQITKFVDMRRHYPYKVKVRGTIEPLDEVKEEEENIDLKVNIRNYDHGIRSHHYMH